MYRNSASAALQRAYQSAQSRPYPADQIINAKDALNLLPAASLVPAATVRLAWLPLLSGQAIPLPGERVDDNSDGTFGAGI